LGDAEAVLISCDLDPREAGQSIAEIAAATKAPVVAAGGYADHRAAVALVNAGARDYFALPDDLERLRAWFDQIVRQSHARVNGEALAARERTAHDLSRLVGESAGFTCAVKRAAAVIAHGGTTVLITGEAGTGKDLLAQAIHYGGIRGNHPFIDLDCSNHPAAQLEAELFGQEKDALEDVRVLKPGLFEVAQGGTLFLDEVSGLTMETQARLLRALETQQIRRLGGVRSIPINVQVIAVSRIDLAAAVQEGRFRADLYDRLSLMPIELPPLRARGTDVLLLARSFLDQMGERYGMTVPPINDAARAALLSYAWPGNVRELRNALERALLLGEGELRAADLIPGGRAAASHSPIPFPATMDEIEHEAAIAMMQRCDGNKSAAAAALGISRSRLYRLLGETEPA
jgi:two-component system response regulator HydG